jgi:hypothetical protein
MLQIVMYHKPNAMKIIEVVDFLTLAGTNPTTSEFTTIAPAL